MLELGPRSWTPCVMDPSPGDAKCGGAGYVYIEAIRTSRTSVWSLVAPTADQTTYRTPHSVQRACLQRPCRGRVEDQRGGQPALLPRRVFVQTTNQSRWSVTALYIPYSTIVQYSTEEASSCLSRRSVGGCECARQVRLSLPAV